jgi:hypothetical protein
MSDNPPEVKPRESRSSPKNPHPSAAVLPGDGGTGGSAISQALSVFLDALGVFGCGPQFNPHKARIGPTLAQGCDSKG